MALSDKEEQILSEIAKNLYAEDPNLRHGLSGDSRSLRFKAVVGPPTAIVGFLLLFAATSLDSVLVGLLAFSLMLVGTSITYFSVRDSRLIREFEGSESFEGVPYARPAKRRKSRSSFMDSIQDRWDRRQRGEI